MAFDSTKWQQVTKDQFDAYRRVQADGKFNMAMEACAAQQEAGLEPGTYWTIVRNYSKLSTKFG